MSCCNSKSPVELPSEKGPDFWYPPKLTPDISKAKAQGCCAPPGEDNITPYSFMHCIPKYTYIWLKDGDFFWSVPVSMDQTGIYLWKWTENSWKFTLIPIVQVYSFMCY